MNAAKFYWAIVGDASPEPVAVVEEDGKRVAYTCGCQDGFDVDGADAKIELIPNASATTHDSIFLYDVMGRPFPMVVPGTPKQRAKERSKREAELMRLEKAGIRHHWRRFNP